WLVGDGFRLGPVFPVGSVLSGFGWGCLASAGVVWLRLGLSGFECLPRWQIPTQRLTADS
ncbi:hypothetical protein ACFL5O_05820, partial [Myxococcota bacterium]